MASVVRGQVTVPLMLAVFFAKLVGDSVCLSVYDTHIKIKGAPVLVRPRLPPPLADPAPEGLVHWEIEGPLAATPSSAVSSSQPIDYTGNFGFQDC